MRNNYKMYKRYKGKKHTIIILFIIVCAFIMTISVGYSVWSSALTIKSSVKLGNGKPFELIPIEDEPGGGEPGIGEQFIISDISSKDAILENQTLEGDRLIVNYKIIERTGTPRTTNSTFNFMNNSAFSMTNITTSYTVTGNRDAIDGNIVITVPSPVLVGELGEINIRTPLKLNKLNNSVTVVCKIDYLVNGTQNSFYIEFVYHK